MDAKKEMYFGKSIYAARKFNESIANASTPLTEAQKDAISTVTSARHWWHVNGTEALSSLASTDNGKATRIATKEYFAEYAEAIASIGCGELYTPVEADGIRDYDDWYYVLEDDEKKEYGENEDDALLAFRDDVYSSNASIVERINGEIEAWLKRVDEKYGTQFAPTGATRVW